MLTFLLQFYSDLGLCELFPPLKVRFFFGGGGLGRQRGGSSVKVNLRLGVPIKFFFRGAERNLNFPPRKKGTPDRRLSESKHLKGRVVPLKPIQGDGHTPFPDFLMRIFHFSHRLSFSVHLL